MSSFAQQIQDSRTAHAAADAIEASAMQSVVQAFQDYENGFLTRQSIRHRLESIIRSSYRASAAVAAQHLVSQSDLPNWTPVATFSNDYLQSLLSDVRRNLRDYKAGEPGSAATRRAILNIQLSASVAAERGYTDQITDGAKQLRDFGYQLKKTWAADYDDNEPCSQCDDLNGTVIEYDSQFPHHSAKVYINLQGPPAHPRCHCRVVLLISALENGFDSIDLKRPSTSSAPTLISSTQVKKISRSMLTSIKAVLRSIISLARKK